MKRVGVSIALFGLLTTGALAQAPAATPPPSEIAILHPGDPDFHPAVFQPFAAEYEQSGVRMRVESVKTGGERPIYSTIMIMPHPKFGVGTDHIGHYADDFAFAFRRFGFRGSYLHVEAQDKVLFFSRMPLPPDETPGSVLKKPIEKPFFDGTMAYWFLAGLPLKLGYTVRLAGWRPGEDGPELSATPPFEVVGKETITAGDGTEYDCWLVEVKGSRFTLRNYVTQRAPYLIQQVMVLPDGKQETVVRLMRMLP